MTLPPSTHTLTLPAAMIKRGFWLYVWKIESPSGKLLLYVGRTGDTSSPKAAAPFTRMSQHLGTNRNENMIRQHLGKRGIRPEDCGSFVLISYGPLFHEVQDMPEHKKRRDKVAALERELAETLARVGYDVLNKVRSKQQLDDSLWPKMHRAFADHFPMLNLPAAGFGSPGGSDQPGSLSPPSV